MVSVAFAFACTLAGAAGFYAAAPRQRLWVSAPARPALLRAASLALLALGCAAWCRALHPAAGFFSALTLTMAVWIALPYAAAWRDARSAGASHGAE